MTRRSCTPFAVRIHPQKGATIVVLLIITLPLILMLALVIDAGIMMISEAQQSNNAEYAAIAALEAYVNSKGSTISSISQRKTIAVEVAEKIAEGNYLLGRPGVSQ